MPLPEDFLFELKQRNHIDSVMGSYVNLIRRGRNYVCLCPFHSEKTPSCTVFMDTDSFYCFGCHAGGDVITFIKLIEHLEYIDAVRLLAERSGLSMPEDSRDRGKAQLKAKILEMNRTAARFFHDNLKSERGVKGRLYLKKRGLSGATVVKYGIGYADDSWDSLRNFMRSKGYSDNDLISAALAAPGKNGGCYDIFRDRVIFPIIDLQGRVIAFGGRIIDGSGPKYLNSPETAVFNKSENLFSLNFAKKSKDKRLILAEGYMDVISINQAGFENVVATLGTACTPQHARLMRSYADEVIIAYDSDGAGQNATKKAIQLLSDAGVRTRILKIEGAKDPDEFIKTYGAERFGLILNRSEGAVNFRLQSCRDGLDMNDEEDKVTYLRRAVKVLAEISGDMEREIYISKLSEEQNISRGIISARVAGEMSRSKKAEKKQEWQNIVRRTGGFDRINPESAKHPREAKAEEWIIVFMLRRPEESGEIAKILLPEDMVTSLGRKVYSILRERALGGVIFSLSDLAEDLNGEEMGRISEIMAKNSELDITLESALSMADTLKSREPEKDTGALTDDDLRALQQKLKDKK